MQVSGAADGRTDPVASTQDKTLETFGSIFLTKVEKEKRVAGGRCYGLRRTSDVPQERHWFLPFTVKNMKQISSFIP